MLTLLHVLIAFTSLAFSTYVLAVPTRTTLRASYALIALTLGSGAYLAAAKPGHLLETCTMGLVYLGLVITATLTARRRLAAATN